MRCCNCFRLEASPHCRHCGATAFQPSADGAVVDHEAALLDALSTPAPGSDDLWDALCVALALLGPTRPIERLGETALADLTPEQHAIFGIFVARATGDEGQAAAHFATAREGADLAPLVIGRRTLQWCPTDDASIVDVVLVTEEDVHALGALDVEAVSWKECRLSEVPLEPEGWQAWRQRVAGRRAANDALLAALHGRDRGVGSRPDSGFRARWKEFQHALSTQRDALAAVDEATQLLDTLKRRDKAAVRAVDVARCISSLVEGARNTLRICADQEREAQVRDLEPATRNIARNAFIGGGLDEIGALREEVARESSAAHAELRKALDYQSRLLRTTQEALHATMTDLAKRASGLLWGFTPQALFDEAGEQLHLLLERAREVAMIEQTDAFLQATSTTIESLLGEIQQDLGARRPVLDGARKGWERISKALDVSSQPVETQDGATLRATLVDMNPGAEAVRCAVEALERTMRAPVLA